MQKVSWWYWPEFLLNEVFCKITSSPLKIEFREEGKIIFLKKVQEVRKHAENVRLEAVTLTRWFFRKIFCTIFFQRGLVVGEGDARILPGAFSGSGWMGWGAQIFLRKNKTSSKSSTHGFLCDRGSIQNQCKKMVHEKIFRKTSVWCYWSAVDVWTDVFAHLQPFFFTA